MAIASYTYGQQIKIIGKVMDADGVALPGVSILVQGTQNGTVSDADGSYSLQVPSSDSVLVFSYVGFVTENISVQNRTQIDVKLVPDLKRLDDVVVVGYGTSKKSDLTSSIVSVKGDDLSAQTQGNFTAALQGKAAGVQVITNNGAPGAVPTVLIRGFTTINLSTDPLYVVDGIPMVNAGGFSNANFLNSDEIESIEVLKDASAAAIYGSRASNGVVLITTKRGKAGKISFNVDLTYGYQIFNKPFDVLNSQNYAKAMNLANQNSNIPPLIANTDNLNYTDWWAAGINKYSPEMNFSASMAGGSEKHTYNVTLTYFKQNSFYHEGDWEKFTARINNDYKPAKWISLGVDLNPRREHWNNTPDWYPDYLKIDPITPIFRPADQLTGTENEYSKYMRSIYTYTWNPVARDSRQFAQGGVYALGANTYVDIHPIKNLVLKSPAGSTFDTQTSDNFNPDFIIDAAHEANYINNVSRQYSIDFNWTWQNTLTYNLVKGKHNASAMIGTTAEEQNWSYVSGYREGLPNNSDAMREIDGATGTVQKAYGNKTRNSIVSYISRVTYNYDNRYLFTGTFRRDGSSKFLENNKWATFPSASVAWRFSNEEFMKKIQFLSDGKLYAGWGNVGNQNLPGDVYLSKLASDYYVFGSGNGTITNLTWPSTQKNPDIKWETVEEKNFGLDLRLFQSALSATVEYFQKTTHNMLFPMNYPYYSGFPNWGNIWTNIGSMQAKGWDVAVDYRHTRENFRFDIGATFSTAQMKMLTLPTGVPQLLGGPTWSGVNTTRTVVGDEPGYFYGYKTNGIFQNWVDVNSHSNEHGDLYQPNARPGDIRFVDTNNDGVLDDKDRVKLGSPYPKFTGGLNFNSSYNTGFGAFDLSLNIYFSYGNKIVDWLKNDKYNAVYQTNLAADAMDKSWHGEGTSGDIPILSHIDLNQNYSRFSDFYVEDGSFARLKNIQFGFTLPQRLLQSLKVSKIRVYVSGQNLLTLTKFKGIDPEAGFSPLNYGFQGFSYPVLKTVLFGANLSF
jgi:TonB-linked SusC/RagA family outer membrane protein